MSTAPRIVEGLYLRDILAQPLALRETLAGLRDTPGELEAITLRIERGELNRVVLTGMGSSFHALHPLHLQLIGRGMWSSMVETSELLHHQLDLLGPATLLVVVSQSGRSAETVRLLETESGSCVIAVTNTADSPLAAAAEATVLTRADEEASISCKTYVTALVALAWLGSVLEGADAGTASAPLLTAGQAVGEYLANWRAHVADLGGDLDGVSDIFLVGRGTSLAAAGTGGLIVKESTRVHAEGMSSAAFRHGPMEMVSDSVFVLVFEGAAPTRDLNRRLAADVHAGGGRCALVAREAERPALRLARLAPQLSPVLEILPVEMLTLALAARDGREAGRFTIGRKVTTSE